MSCNFRYESVVGTGRVEIVLEEEKEKALTLLMNHYHPVSVKFNPKFVHMTQCMKIIVNDMTAKRAMPKKNTLDYKVMQFQGEVRSPHMYEEKNRSLKNIRECVVTAMAAICQRTIANITLQEE